MMRMRRSWLALVAIAGVLSAGGCCRDKLDLPKPGRLCESRYAIVETRGPTCEALLGGGDWKLVPRRETAPNVRQRKRAAVSPNQSRTAAPGAQPFCVYEWARKERPMAEAFSRIGGTQECALAVGLAGSAALPPPVPPPPGLPPSGPIFHQNFERQVKAFASPSAAKAWEKLQKAGTGRPVVAVLDTSPYGVTRRDASGHGYAMSRIIGHVACVGGADAPGCPDVVRPYVALPLVYKNGSWQPGPDGGFVGYFHDLSDAFQQALADRPDAGHLIVNLSLGWDPTTTEPNGTEVRKMKELLEWAYCEGVLVIGAAGNGTTTAQAPVLPAGLESTRDLPDTARCQQLGITNPKLPARGARYRALIHSVGSVDLYDERLPTVRAWAHPRIAAYGESVTIPGPGGTFSDPSTGTSDSAAAISSMAAALWTIKPNLDTAQVMAAIYDGGHLLQTRNKQSRTELCLDTAGDRCQSLPAHRATLCGAVKAVGETVDCIAPPHPDRSDTATAPPRPPGTFGTPKPPAINGRCGVTNCGVPTGANPTQGMAAVGPMGVATCGGCVLYTNFGNGMLTGRLNFDVPPDWFYTTVIVYDSSFVPRYYYPFEWSTPNGWFWQGMPSGSTSDVLGAEIDWTYYAGGFWWTDAASLRIAP
jgi:hypothetical protein